MNPFFKNKFDLIVSLGEDCACTSCLRRCNLQTNSYPFDWLTNAKFTQRIDLVLNDFKDFLNIEYIKPIEKVANNDNDKKYDLYQNTLNGLHFYHDFPIGIPLEESIKIVGEKYERRIKRLYENIEKSEKILFVWFSHTELHETDKIINEYNRLKEKFANKDIFLLIFENTPEKSWQTLENGHIMLIHQDTYSKTSRHNWDKTLGNRNKNLKVFKKIKLKLTMEQKFKRFIYHILYFLVKFVPIKSIRKKWKGDLNMLFFHAKL